MIDLLWDIHQNAQISSLQNEITSKNNNNERLNQKLEGVVKQVRRLTLMNQALWELLQEKMGLTEAEFLAKITEVDGRDGQVDGKLTSARMTCPSCQRPQLGRKNDRCDFCQEPLPQAHVFDAKSMS